MLLNGILDRLGRRHIHEQLSERERLCAKALSMDGFLQAYIRDRFVLQVDATGSAPPIVQFEPLPWRTRLRLAWRLLWRGSYMVG